MALLSPACLYLSHHQTIRHKRFQKIDGKYGCVQFVALPYTRNVWTIVWLMDSGGSAVSAIHILEMGDIEVDDDDRVCIYEDVKDKFKIRPV